MQRTTRLLLFLLAPVATLAAQSASDPSVAVPPSFSIERTAGLGRVDGVLRGAGARYAAEFHPDGMEFAPALGADAPHLRPLRLRLASIYRDAAQPWRAGPAELHADALIAEYRRPRVTERYEVRPDGVEQSFVLRELPPGDGDLVIALDVETALEPRIGESQDGLFWAVPETDGRGLGGVRVGTVTVFDADGRSTGGTLRLHEDALELVTPAEFVRTAALPLTVDPLIGTVSSKVTHLVGKLKVAFEPTHQVYLVAWESHFTSSDIVINTQRVAVDGSLIGLQDTMSLTGTNLLGGVATVDPNDSFVVVWERRESSGDSNVRARALHAQTGNKSLTVDVAAAPNVSESQPDVGSVVGRLSGFNPVVFRETSASLKGRIRVRGVTLNSAFELRSGTTVDLTSGSETDFQPAISRASDLQGRSLVVWSRSGNIRGAVINATRNVLVQDFAITPNDGHARAFPALDGDGDSWLVTYERNEVPGAVFSAADLYCQQVAYHAATRQAAPNGAERLIDGTGGVFERTGQVLRLVQSYLVAYTDGLDPVLQSVDPAACTACEGRFVLDSPVANSFPLCVGVAGPFSGGPSGVGQPLVVWNHDGPNELRWQAFAEKAGATIDLQGGCGQGGAALASCAKVGNPGFAFRLRQAAPGAPAFLVLGVALANVPCGPCTLVPRPLVNVPASTNALGTASVSLPLSGNPALAGATISYQWVTGQPGGLCLAGLDFSNAQSVVISP